MVNEICRLIIGDWSGDGHSKTETILVEIISEQTVLPQNIELAFDNGCAIIGKNILQELDEYQAVTLSSNSVKKLREHGLLTDAEFLTMKNLKNEDDWSIWIDPEFYIDLYIRIVHLANPPFTLKRIDVPHVNIGGYGLYD